MFTKRIQVPMNALVHNIVFDTQFSIRQRHPYTTKIKEWLKPVIDLEDFYVYPMNGITGCLDYWASRERKGIFQNKGDYEWIMQTGNDMQYISVPSSIDGNFVEVPQDVPVALDIAYVGTTAIKKIQVTPNVEKVFYSLSKPFGIQNARTGWYFTRRPDSRLHKLTYEAEYYNYYAHAIAERLIDNFAIDYTYNYYVDKQIAICEEHNLTPSDSVWLATSKDEKYKDFVRANNTARLCLCEEIQ